MTTVKFVPNPGKPHLKIKFDDFGTPSYYLAPIGGSPSKRFTQAHEYSLDVNPGQYSTPGEAARALFNYRGEDK